MNKIKILVLASLALIQASCIEFIGFLDPVPTDPKLKWTTLSTQNFDIHYHSGLEKVGPKVGKICEEVHAVLSKEIGWKTWGKVQVVVADISDEVDAKAVEFPYPQMLILLARPEPYESLANYDDWLQLVITHEYTHILHLDMAGGFWGAMRYVFGRVVLPASVIPTWMSEGYAVYQESDKTGKGRNNSTFQEMIMRMDALEDHFQPIDRLASGTGVWPYGSQAYFYGGKFHDWLAQKFPEAHFAEYHRRYANNALNFLLIEYHAQKLFGKGFYRLHNDFKSDLKDLYGKEKILMEQKGLMEGQRLTSDGEVKLGLLYAPAGDELLFSSSSGDHRELFEKLALNSPKHERKIVEYDLSASDYTWDPKKEAIYFSHAGSWKDYYTYSAMNAFSWKKKTIKTVKFKGPKIEDPLHMPRKPLEALRRTSHPHMSINGDLAFVFRHVDHDSIWVASQDPAGPYSWNKKHFKLKMLTEGSENTEYDHPRWSPDGKTIAVSKFDPALKQRDIILIKNDGTQLKSLTKDEALDFYPVWDSKGENLYFVSDRTGVFNVFCYQMKTDLLYQVTNVVGGTFFPVLSPDDKRLAYLGYHARGFDVYEMPLSRDHFIKVNKSAMDERKHTPAKNKVIKESPKKLKKKSGKTAQYNANDYLIDPSNNDDPVPESSPSSRIRNYTPFQTLFLPRFLAPVFQIVDNDDFIIGGAMGSTDAVRRHSWRAIGYYRTKINEPGGQLVYRYVGWYPELFVSGNITPIAQDGYLLVRSPISGRVFSIRGQFEDNLFVQQDRIARAGFSLKFPVRQIPGLSWVPGKHRLSAGYQFISRNNQSDINPSFVTFNGVPNPVPVMIPTEYDASGVFVHYSYKSTLHYKRGISPTGEINTPRDFLKGYSLSLGYQMFNDALGGNWNQQVFIADLRQYRRVPFTRHHVIALRGVGAFTYGDDSNPETFRLGGAYSEGDLNSTTRNFYPLRGFGGVTAQGERMFLLSGEYRFPIVNVERGISVYPIFLKNIHGAFFADYGDARDRFFLQNDGLSFDRGYMGVGGELRSSFGLFYGANLDVRLGYGIPVLANKNAFFDFTDGEFIFNIGTTF